MRLALGLAVACAASAFYDLAVPVAPLRGQVAPTVFVVQVVIPVVVAGTFGGEDWNTTPAGRDGLGGTDCLNSWRSCGSKRLPQNPRAHVWRRRICADAASSVGAIAHGYCTLRTQCGTLLRPCPA